MRWCRPSLLWVWVWGLLYWAVGHVGEKEQACDERVTELSHMKRPEAVEGMR